jgi:hypothetical protein
MATLGRLAIGIQTVLLYRTKCFMITNDFPSKKWQPRVSYMEQQPTKDVLSICYEIYAPSAEGNNKIWRNNQTGGTYLYTEHKGNTFLRNAGNYFKIGRREDQEEASLNILSHKKPETVFLTEIIMYQL